MYKLTDQTMAFDFFSFKNRKLDIWWYRYPNLKEFVGSAKFKTKMKTDSNKQENNTTSKVKKN